MPEMIADGPVPQSPAGVAGEAYAQLPPPFGEVAARTATETAEMAVSAMRRALYEQDSGWGQLGRSIAFIGAGGAEGVVAPSGPVGADLAPLPSPRLSKAEAVARYPDVAKEYPDTFAEGMPQGVVDALGDAKRNQMQREGVFARYYRGGSLSGNVATQMALNMLDPVMDTAMLVPGVGEEALLAPVAARLGTGIAARFAVRGIAAGTAGAAGMAGPAALRYGLSQATDGDYGLRQAFLDFASGAAFGAALHAGVFGSLREAGISSLMPSCAPLDAPTHAMPARGRPWRKSLTAARSM